MVNTAEEGQPPVLSYVSEMTVLYSSKRIVLKNFGVPGHHPHVDSAAYIRQRVDGCRVLWSLPSVYRSLGLREAHGQAGRWLNKRLDSWLRQLPAMLNDTVVLQRSQQGNLPEARLDQFRNLPWLAASTVTLLAVLLRLLGNKPERGGVENPDTRRLFRQFLEHLVRAGTQCNRAFCLHVDEYAEIAGPPLHSHGGYPVRAELRAGGFLNIPEDEAECNPALLQSLRDGSRDPLVGLNLLIMDWLQEALKVLAALSLVGQVLGVLGRNVERELFSEDSEAGCIYFDGDTVSDLGHGNLAVESALIRLLEIQQKKAEDKFMFFSLGTDKARVGSMGFQNVVGATPDGVGWYGPPQVPSISFPHSEVFLGP